MKPEERQTYYDRLRERARDIGENKDLQELLALTISTNELRKTENLRNALELPPISEMTNAELRDYIETLSSFEPRQTFL